jgi:hypothetical protein
MNSLGAQRATFFLGIIPSKHGDYEYKGNSRRDAAAQSQNEILKPVFPYYFPLCASASLRENLAA